MCGARPSRHLRSWALSTSTLLASNHHPPPAIMTRGRRRTPRRLGRRRERLPLPLSPLPLPRAATAAASAAGSAPRVQQPPAAAVPKVATAVFLVASLMNHERAGRMSTTREIGGETMVVRARWALKKGMEVTTWYHSDPQALLSKWGIVDA